tara:strand:+ start:1189 stop:2661 length:1473 start_codon:yes stop_codon:yes gene_type:complete
MKQELDGIALTANGKAESISPQALTFFEKRGISAETVVDLGIYTDSGALVFPTYEGDNVVNLKFRTHDKKFWQSKEGTRTFYNPIGLDLAIQEDKPLVICEGEIDCISIIESRYAWVVSVPDGAPAKEKDFYGIDEDNKFQFIWDNLAKLDKVKTFILAGDADEPGKVLNLELSKRLGLERCKYVTYPEGCKDFNDVLVTHGKAMVNELINTARPWPVVGLFKPDEFPPMPEEFKKPYSTGYGYDHDQKIKLMLGKFCVITGYPGSGKSEYADGLVLNLAKLHGWNICVCSTEINSEEYQENTLRRIWRRPIENVNEDEQARALAFYQKHYSFITNQTMDDELELTIEKLLDIAEMAVLKYDAKVLLLDPWNELDHKRGGNGENETEYTNRAIKLLKRFSKQWGVLVIVVAHPKMPDQQGKLKPPTPYSISGSAAWFNKADYALVLWRESNEGNSTELIVSKIKRHGPMGHPGYIQMKLDEHTKRFIETE